MYSREIEVQLREKARAAEITMNRIESYYADNDEFDPERVRRDNLEFNQAEYTIYNYKVYTRKHYLRRLLCI
jgi:hypothetical protein